MQQELQLRLFVWKDPNFKIIFLKDPFWFSQFLGPKFLNIDLIPGNQIKRQ